MTFKNVFWSVGVAVAMPLSASALDFSGYLRTGTGNALEGGSQDRKSVV